MRAVSLSEVTDPTQAVLALFAEDLADIKFPDVDAAVLRAAAEEVERARAAVTAREAELEAAQDALATKLDTLTAKASRALAYARIYAETNTALLEKVNLISMARMARPAEAVPSSPPAKRRGRPPKNATVARIEEAEGDVSAA